MPIIIIRKFTKHFAQRWAERVGGWPCLDEVNRIVREGQRLRGQQTLYRKGGDGTLTERVILEEYWNNREGLIIRIDADCATAVTVITPERTGNGNKTD